MDLIGPIARQVGQRARPARDVDLDADRLIGDELLQSADEVESRVEFLAERGRIVAAATLDGNRGGGEHRRQLDRRVVDLFRRFRPGKTACRKHAGRAEAGHEKLTSRKTLPHAWILISSRG